MQLWRSIQKENFTCINKLADFLQLSSQDRLLLTTKRAFPLNLPKRLAEKIEKSNLQDPIAKQFIPLIEEHEKKEGFFRDPVQDLHFCTSSHKLIQKYHGRALLTVSSACAMHCRYCFRQNFPYDTDKSFSKELHAISENKSLKEVILSGGDPLSLSTDRLFELLHELDAIDHLERIRFHTRFPIGIPERIDSLFLTNLSKLRKQIIFIIHINHPHELDQDIFSSLKSIQKIGVPVLSQTVLLKGVNDQVAVLKLLFENLSAQGIIPYYLHSLDKVEGSHHFEVPEATGLFLMKQLSTQVSGYCLPRYVKEVPGHLSKTPV